MPISETMNIGPSLAFVDCDLTSETFEDYVDLIFCGVFPASG